MNVLTPVFMQRLGTRHCSILVSNERSAQVSALSSEAQLLRVSKRVLQVVLRRVVATVKPFWTLSCGESGEQWR